MFLKKLGEKMKPLSSAFTQSQTVQKAEEVDVLRSLGRKETEETQAKEESLDKNSRRFIMS